MITRSTKSVFVDLFIRTPLNLERCFREIQRDFLIVYVSYRGGDESNRYAIKETIYTDALPERSIAALATTEKYTIFSYTPLSKDEWQTGPAEEKPPPPAKTTPLADV